MEINGYEIDNYNHLVLKTELKMMFAHFVLLIEKRKQINVSLHWDTGFKIIGEKGQLHTFKRKENTKQYKTRFKHDKSRLQR
jgi:hypothetical protein